MRSHRSVMLTHKKLLAVPLANLRLKCLLNERYYRANPSPDGILITFL